MIETIVLLILIAAVIGAIYLNQQLAKSVQGVDYYEDIVATNFSARSHRLISECIRIDQLPYTWQKHEEYNNLISKMYEYMDDYEMEVAQMLPKDSSVVAYAGIRLVEASQAPDITK